MIKPHLGIHLRIKAASELPCRLEITQCEKDQCIYSQESGVSNRGNQTTIEFIRSLCFKQMQSFIFFSVSSKIAS